jgi:transglutaminase/protease-like cytokinesis protein 3
MRKIKLFICILFIGTFSISIAQNNYAAIDKKILKIPTSETKTSAGIAKYINANFSSQDDKSRAIFSWIANNINYDVENMYTFNYYEHVQEVIDKVLKTREGVCLHYAVLFNDIATQVGLKSYTISGYIKQDEFPNYVAHSWCAVEIDSKWYLFDPTWGAGYIQNHKFVKKVTDSYYKANPAELIKSHMPFDPLWQFSNYPITNQNFYDKKISQNKENSFFNYTDTLKVYEQLSDIEKLSSSSKRIEKNGVKNALIANQLKYNRTQIEYLNNTITLEKYNTAVNAYNEGVTGLNNFIRYRNSQFNPKKSDEDITLMISNPESSLNTAQQNLNEIKSASSNLASAILDLQKKIDEAMSNLKEQKAFLKKYLNTNKIGRKFFFYKYTSTEMNFN